MFVGQLDKPEHVRALSAHSCFNTAFEWLRQQGGGYPAGITEIDGADFYVNVQDYETKPREQCGWESHCRTTDIQVVLSGSERIDWTTATPDVAHNEQDAESDFVLWPDTIPPQGDLVLSGLSFVVFLPNELHRPAIAVTTPELVRKLVVKIDDLHRI